MRMRVMVLLPLEHHRIRCNFRPYRLPRFNIQFSFGKISAQMRQIIHYSITHKFLILLLVLGLVASGIYSMMNIPVGAVPDITNNQVQVISTSRNLPTEEVERFLTTPVELGLANLPGVVEIRSISKFGLSVVTVVFEDRMGSYLPRQLITEKLKEIESEIPAGFGSPTMGPISTGLGEIYQYILDVKPGYEDRYSTMDLRTIQDWIVKRQLSGISGVVEINTWGGFLKTYEVAVDPYKLRQHSISLDEVYQVVSDNNSVAGGGYIEKNNEAYFIRADGLLSDPADLEKTVIKVVGNKPILIRDVAKVVESHATRFGAITGNGEGEKVLGQIMMLKGADSKKVIDQVMSRVNSIQSSLPEGVYVNPILSRSDLISRTTMTITENLLFGFLIVLFVVIFLLGNIRSGLVVASVIPLTLFFALTCMYVFGVDANLMSLGAIDFGIIIDGAVIIVEYITFQLSKQMTTLSPSLVSTAKSQKDRIVEESTDKMMHSAVFGQIIIIIVFIPILALTGIEGKMFRPMAMTFCFAILGAMLLCFTYVPVASVLFITTKKSWISAFSERFTNSLRRAYRPLLKRALRAKTVVLSAAVIIFIISAYLFTRLGGEFVPTLDEGDFVIQPVFKTGMSLNKTVEMTTQIEKILKRYPEVNQVVTRIGAAEVPTDPMSMEESDVIVTLNNKRTWSSARSKDELANVFKEAILDEIPAIDLEFTQPIEMRFNELISGARTDLAVKIYGEDLEVLYEKATEIANAIQNVDGAADISVEKIEGLPQIAIEYNRDRLARYGMDVATINDLVLTGLAGKTAGTFYEGGAKFDLVVRLAKKYRNDYSRIRLLPIDLPTGEKRPLAEFATISETTGPAKISRDNTNRNAVVGVNVRDRDLQSVVKDIQELVQKNISLPSGYYIAYGGQFENLKVAKKTLSYAVPVSLVLIFIILYFTFGSVLEALLIYSAIPLAAIGGIWALIIRQMPFSISAGIGFIALFGIAVLNGIVLIEHFKELKSQKMNDDNIILTGAVDRLRPVLLTAFSAALGFLPMAISTSAGAEVQRPLATVVIGGLVSATLLTLFVLPVLYRMYLNRNGTKPNTTVLGTLIIFLLPVFGQAQQNYSADEILKMAEEYNPNLYLAEGDIAIKRAEVNAIDRYGHTEFYYAYDKNNLPEVGGPLHVFGLHQNLKLPSVYASEKKYKSSLVEQSERRIVFSKLALQKEVSLVLDKIQYSQNLLRIYERMDSIYALNLDKTQRKYDLGEGTLAEALLAREKKDNSHLLILEQEWKIEDEYSRLYDLVRGPEKFRLRFVSYAQHEESSTDSLNIVMENYYEKAQEVLSHEIKMIKAKSKPELNLTLFTGLNDFSEPVWYPGLQAGIALPLSRKPFKARLEAKNIERQMLDYHTDAALRTVTINQERLIQQISNLDYRIVQYRETLALTSQSLREIVDAALDKEVIDFFDYLTVIEGYYEALIKDYDLVHEYNQAIISLQYMTIE